MSMYFFRLHNLRRAQEEDKRKRQQQQQQRQQRQRTRRGTIVHRLPVDTPLTLAPSRLFERPPLTPSDSLDEVALQIPRCSYVNIICLYVSHCMLLYIQVWEITKLLG